MFKGKVLVGGGIIPASTSFFGSIIRLAAHSINAVDDEFGDDVDEDDDESSFAKHRSEVKKELINTELASGNN